MSYELKISPKDRAGSRFVGSVHRALVAAALDAREEDGLTQQQVAEKLGVNRSFVNRVLRGGANLTVRTIGEIAWALGYEAAIQFRRRQRPKRGDNKNYAKDHVSGARASSVTSNVYVQTASTKPATRRVEPVA